MDENENEMKIILDASKREKKNAKKWFNDQSLNAKKRKRKK